MFLLDLGVFVGDGLVPEGARGEAPLFVGEAAVVAHYLDAVAGFALIDEVVVADYVDGARELAGGGFFRHFLDGDGLVVFVD
jgi:hypothetical protein